MRARVGVAVALALAAAGCSDALDQASSAGQIVAFSDSSALSLIAAIGHAVTTLDLGTGYSRAALASHGSVFLVWRSGNARDTGVVDVVDLALATSAPTDSVRLAGALLGAAIADDSLAWVAVSDHGAVARVNYRTHNVTTITVGGTPRAVAFTAGHVFVINATPSGSWVSVVNPATNLVVDSIPLAAPGANAAVVGGDSLLYVTEAGAGGGKVSVVDPAAYQELVVIEGLGPGITSPVFHPAGRLLLADPSDGVLEINTLTRSVTRGPGQGIKPGGHGVVALGLDNGGRVYAADSSCGVVHVLAPPPDYGELHALTVTGCPTTAATAVQP